MKYAGLKSINRVSCAPLLASLVLALLLAGCAAPTQRLSAEDKARVKAAKLNTNVEVPASPFLLAPGDGGLGAVGGARTAGGIEESRKGFVTYLDKNAISIQKIAFDEIERALRDSGKLAFAAASDTTAPQININVKQYGFGVTHVLSASVVPVLWVQCDMVDGAGKVIWSASERMVSSIGSPMEAIAWEQLVKDPKLMEEQWRKAARFAARKIVGEL
jgi:hypothetical protein